jgi:hypothetical protein
MDPKMGVLMISSSNRHTHYNPTTSVTYHGLRRMVCYDIHSLLNLTQITATAVVFFYFLFGGEQKQRHKAHDWEDLGRHHKA